MEKVKPKKIDRWLDESVLVAQSPNLERFIHEIACLNLNIGIEMSL